MERAMEAPVSRRRFGLRELIILVLAAGIAALVWKVDAQAKELARTEGLLNRERQELAVTKLSLRTAEFRIANRELDTVVKGDILDERIASQVARAEQLEKETEALRQQLLRETNCVTPRSVRSSDL